MVAKNSTTKTKKSRIGPPCESCIIAGLDTQVGITTSSALGSKLTLLVERILGTAHDATSLQRRSLEKSRTSSLMAIYYTKDSIQLVNAMPQFRTYTSLSGLALGGAVLADFHTDGDYTGYINTVQFETGHKQLIGLPWSNTYDFLHTPGLRKQVNDLVHYACDVGLNAMSTAIGKSELVESAISACEHLSFAFVSDLAMVEAKDDKSKDFRAHVFLLLIVSVNDFIVSLIEALHKKGHDKIAQGGIRASLALIRLKLENILEGLQTGTLIPICVSRAVICISKHTHSQHPVPKPENEEYNWISDRGKLQGAQSDSNRARVLLQP
jgi:hypothetical protein